MILRWVAQNFSHTIFHTTSSNYYSIFMVPLTPKFFCINKIFGPGFFLQMLYFLKVFGPWTTIQENGPSSLCDIITGFHSCTKQAQTERDNFLFLTECLIHVLFLDITSKVTQEMAELCTEYQQSQLRVSEKKGKN